MTNWADTFNESRRLRLRRSSIKIDDIWERRKTTVTRSGSDRENRRREGDGRSKESVLDQHQ